MAEVTRSESTATVVMTTGEARVVARRLARGEPWAEDEDGLFFATLVQGLFPTGGFMYPEAVLAERVRLATMGD